MVRVLQIGLTNNRGGLESFVMNYYRRIDRDKIQFDFINFCDHLAYEEEIKQFGGHIYNITNYKKNPLKYFMDIKAIAKKYSVVHIQVMSLANFLPILAARSAGTKKIIIHSHSSQSFGVIHHLLDNVNRRWLQRMNVVLLACSENAGEWMFGNKPFMVIKNSIDVERFQFDELNREKVRQELNIPLGAFVVGHVGMLEKEKNQSYLIDVFSELHKAHPDSYLVIVGEGSLRTELTNQIVQLGLKDNVLLTGIRKDVDKIYSSFDCFVMPSIFEGLPFVLIEAQANGLHCYVSKEGISNESCLLPDFSFLSIQNEPEQWSECILQSNNSRNKDAVKLIGAHGFDISTSVEKIAAIYMSR